MRDLRVMARYLSPCRWDFFIAILLLLVEGDNMDLVITLGLLLLLGLADDRKEEKQGG